MLTELSCREFAQELASKKPIPGGGGAAALTAALGVALNTMVANYSIGKKKFMDCREQHEELIARGEALREKFVDLVNKDAEYFEPLSRAYVMPSNTDEEKKLKEQVLQKCLKEACSAPMETLVCTYEAILLHKGIQYISSNNIISDVGVGVQFLKAALNSAYLNVLINLNSIIDEDYVTKQKAEAVKLVSEGIIIADEVYNMVLKTING
ncbi:MAG: cyclodeaminase/cyclohydrolase family protein [Sedimentibacter sp.]|uniref:cyclodeaminase/cyclohydrolase family protein n=1 Tax=Sedimentibacter sp. TaxID=1960295 RepID=UPI0029823679|nr:cyclodeaminase/cyclohydrolase family protein [Sedimentibacter sp.]MDW5300196.1 cyclodeaminase/cyclohydrolase family protein [Sedimentibacter sp.]